MPERRASANVWSLGMEEQLYTLYVVYLVLRRRLPAARCHVHFSVPAVWEITALYVLPQKLGHSILALGFRGRGHVPASLQASARKNWNIFLFPLIDSFSAALSARIDCAFRRQSRRGRSGLSFSCRFALPSPTRSSGSSRRVFCYAGRRRRQGNESRHSWRPWPARYSEPRRAKKSQTR
jgi:hypothetical protein